jgi:hypothetical protein
MKIKAVKNIKTENVLKIERTSVDSKTLPVSINENKKTSKMKRIKKRVCELLEESSSHGIPNIARNRNLFSLVMWSSFTILSVCLGTHFIIKSILEYLKYNTFTNIEIINEQKAQFPGISFCALPSFNSSINQTFSLGIFDNIFETNLSQYVEEYNDITMGKCFRYNSGKNIYNESYQLLNSTIKGFKYGLKLTLNIQIPEDYDYAEIYLFIYNQSLRPFDSENSHGFWILPGSYYYFELDRVFYKNLDAPYSNCLKDINSFKKNKTIIDNIRKKNRDYTQANCYYLCSFLFALEESNCGCNSTLIDFSKNCIRNYNTIETEMTRCNSKYLKEFRKNKQNNVCSEYCPLECDSMDFVITPHSYAILSSGNISKKSKSLGTVQYSTYEELRKKYLPIRVYYNELKYTVINEKPETESFKFISEIGGILGLFLGISFLSLIEIFEIIYEIQLVLFRKK